MKFRKTVEYGDETVVEVSVQSDEEYESLHEFLNKQRAVEVEND